MAAKRRAAVVEACLADFPEILGYEEWVLEGEEEEEGEEEGRESEEEEQEAWSSGGDDEGREGSSAGAGSGHASLNGAALRLEQ